MEHDTGTHLGMAKPKVDCSADPIKSLVEMFVGLVQRGRINKGQCPAQRPVFLKPHGVARGIFRVRPELPKELKVGVFSGVEYPAWLRFSSDTLPTLPDYKTTLGLGIKLFGVSGPKIFGAPSDTTFDFILQNSDIFFVDTAADMCAFTKAGVVDGDYAPYLAAHPDTKRILDEMAKSVRSVLASPYWSGVPFAFGVERYVKYKLEPTLEAMPDGDVPTDPGYLGADLERRLKAGAAAFRFYVQFRVDPAMPLDQATVRWLEAKSEFVHVADLMLPPQDVTARGQQEYGENLSYNIWRVTEEHRPQGSIAEARRVVYAAAAELRRDVNGIPVGEPDHPRQQTETPQCFDSTILRASIHPAIGVARIGDSAGEFYVCPEVTVPQPEVPGFYRDSQGALKRGAARFRLFGFNAAGQVVREITPDNADIQWTVHLANKKAQWYQFQAAMDLPEAAALSVPRRNADVTGLDRQELAINPGPRSISGKSVSGGKTHIFDTGTFKGVSVALGEIQTDAAGRLLVLGGHGKSASPSGAPIFNPSDPNSFNNADDWFDDTSDGPVTATVSINGKPIPVDPAWVVVAPPNFAPHIVGWRTLFDLLEDVYVQCGWFQMPETLSFVKDILPILRRLSNLQWVNKGFAAIFGKNCPMDFDNDELIAKLAFSKQSRTDPDPYGELRQAIFNCFRLCDTSVNEPRIWPWIYGDAFGSFASASPKNNLGLSSVKEVLLKRWAEGQFVNDWNPSVPPAQSTDQMALADQPGMLDRASLQFCLADAFHPGCEMTWPMRHASVYEKPFRLRHRPAAQSEPDYGNKLTPQIALQPGGPIAFHGPGDVTRWMALPWQGDTAFCRSGYEPEYDPYLPTFWPARVPNQVLTEEDYEMVMDTSLPREQRIAAFHCRFSWLRTLKGSAPEAMMQMVAHFGSLGVVESRPGPKGDPDFPELMFVESLAGSKLKASSVEAARLARALPAPPSRVLRAGWESEEQFEDFRRIRVRPR
jgi:hypothetical protein